MQSMVSRQPHVFPSQVICVRFCTQIDRDAIMSVWCVLCATPDIYQAACPVSVSDLQSVYPLGYMLMMSLLSMVAREKRDRESMPFIAGVWVLALMRAVVPSAGVMLPAANSQCDWRLL